MWASPARIYGYPPRNRAFFFFSGFFPIFYLPLPAGFLDVSNFPPRMDPTLFHCPEQVSLVLLTSRVGPVLFSPLSVFSFLSQSLSESPFHRFVFLQLADYDQPRISFLHRPLCLSANRCILGIHPISFCVWAMLKFFPKSSLSDSTFSSIAYHLVPSRALFWSTFSPPLVLWCAFLSLIHDAYGHSLFCSPFRLR